MHHNFITLLHSGSGDWVGLYINGTLSYEGHNISEREILIILAKKFNFSFEDIYDEKEDYFERFGSRCPEHLPLPEDLK